MAQQEEWTVVRMLNWATEYFRDKSVPSPRLSIEWLLAEVLGLKRLDLYMQYDRPLTPAELEELRPLVKRRAKHEPLQYITGYTEFFNCRFKVGPGVLIPRPETELLTEMVAGEFDPSASVSILDIGTGSGCIAIALKYERPAWQISAVDISPEAIAIAKENAELNEVQVAWHLADFNNEESWPLTEKFDAIVSNPPYVAEEEFDELESQVKDFEPRQALHCQSPAQIYANLVRTAEKYLKPGGLLFAELNTTVDYTLSSAIDSGKWQYQTLQDYDNKERFLKARLLG